MACSGLSEECTAIFGICRVLSTIHPRFADVATPLVYLTGKDVPFVWDSSCSATFHELRAALIDAPILAFPTETGQYILDTDASNFGLGGCLKPDPERPGTGGCIL